MAGTITTAMAYSFKQEVLEGYHLFLASGGNTFNMCLLKGTVTGTYGTGTTNYSNVTGNSDETSDTSGNSQYTAGGQAMTPNANPSLSSGVAYVSWTTNPSWGPSASISSGGALLYNASSTGGSSGRAVAVFSFGGTQSSTLGTFTVTLPSATYTTALLRLA